METISPAPNKADEYNKIMKVFFDPENSWPRARLKYSDMVW